MFVKPPIKIHKPRRYTPKDLKHAIIHARNCDPKESKTAWENVDDIANELTQTQSHQTYTDISSQF
jgi:hypothetical protein